MREYCKKEVMRWRVEDAEGTLQRHSQFSKPGLLWWNRGRENTCESEGEQQ